MARKQTYSPNVQALLSKSMGGNARMQPGDTSGVSPNLAASLMALGYLPKHRNMRGELMMPGQTQGGSGLDNQSFRGLDDLREMQNNAPGGGPIGGSRELPGGPNWRPGAPLPTGFDPAHPTVISKGTTADMQTYPGLDSQRTTISLSPTGGEEAQMAQDRAQFANDPSGFLRGLRQPAPTAVPPQIPGAPAAAEAAALLPNQPQQPPAAPPLSYNLDAYAPNDGQLPVWPWDAAPEQPVLPGQPQRPSLVPPPVAVPVPPIDTEPMPQYGSVTPPVPAAPAGQAGPQATVRTDPESGRAIPIPQPIPRQQGQPPLPPLRGGNRNWLAQQGRLPILPAPKLDANRPRPVAQPGAQAGPVGPVPSPVRQYEGVPQDDYRRQHPVTKHLYPLIDSVLGDQGERGLLGAEGPSAQLPPSLLPPPDMRQMLGDQTASMVGPNQGPIQRPPQMPGPVPPGAVDDYSDPLQGQLPPALQYPGQPSGTRAYPPTPSGQSAPPPPYQGTYQPPLMPPGYPGAPNRADTRPRMKNRKR